MIQPIITSPQKKRLIRIENGDGEETNQVDEGFGKDGYLYSVSKTLINIAQERTLVDSVGTIIFVEATDMPVTEDVPGEFPVVPCIWHATLELPHILSSAFPTYQYFLTGFQGQRQQGLPSCSISEKS